MIFYKLSNYFSSDEDEDDSNINKRDFDKNKRLEEDSDENIEMYKRNLTNPKNNALRKKNNLR